MNDKSNQIEVTPGFYLSTDEVQLDAVRSSGAGGQNVNKVSTAIHLRFDVCNATLPARVKERLLSGGDRRITDEGVIIIKAQRLRTQARNRQDALDRLVEILREASVVRKVRHSTRPTRGSKERRLKNKSISSKNKILRRKPSIES